MEVRKGLLYSQDHEWVKITGSIARIGITAYAQDQLWRCGFCRITKC